MERELYLYSTETYLREGLIKVGDSNKGRHKTRIREQFGTSNPELPIVLLVMPLPDGMRDHDIHAQMKKNGVRKKKDSAGKEWFFATIDQVKLAYNQIVFGKSRTENYSPRAEQKEAVDKAKKWFDKDYPDEVLGSATHQERFLLNAKMRFGKCFTGLHIGKAIDAKNIIIVTYKPEVIGEWMEAANSHVDFDGWLGIRARKKERNSIEPCLDENGTFPAFDGTKVLCVSLQDLDIDSDGNTKIRLEKVLETHWDLIIFDEVHFGSRTDRAMHIISTLTSIATNRLDLSGTPFRLIQEDDFCSQQVFTYSYLDEKKNKDIEIENDAEGNKPKIYREMPDLEICTIEITEEDIQQQVETFFTDDLDFSLNKLFEANKSGFIHEAAVDHFLDGLVRCGHDARSVSVYGKLGLDLGMPALRHSVWWLNRVDSVNALIRKLQSHPYFSKYSILNAAGSESSDDDHVFASDKLAIEEAIQDASDDSSKLGTITLTCRRFLTGVTIKEWDSILVLNDGKSPESYYQAIFRVQSAWVDKLSRDVLKPKSWCFDFAITRCLRLTYDYADALADQLDQQDSYDQSNNSDVNNLKNTVQGLCDTLNIKRFYDGSLVSNKTTAQDIFEALNLEGSRIALAKRITSDALVDFSALKLLENNEHLFEILKKIKGYRTQDIGGIDDFVKIGKDADKLKKNKKKDEDEDDPDKNKDFEKDGDKEVRSKKKWYATQIKRLAICMADFIYMTYFREYHINHVIQTKEPHFFQVMTGISKDDFTLLCDNGFINMLALNRIVREFKNQEETSLSPEEYIYENLIKLAS